MLNKIVLDLETQKDFAEVGGRNKNHLLKVSVAAIYSYLTDEYLVFEERDLYKLGDKLMEADEIIGYNIRHFDFAVLQPYLNFSLEGVPCLDLLEHVERSLGHRVGLDSVARATLGQGKTGTGLRAIELWKTGKLAELKEYCVNDVKVTKEIYDYALRHGKLLYSDFFEVREIPIEIAEPMKRQNISKQAALF